MYFDAGNTSFAAADGPGSLNKKVPEAFDNLDGKAKFADTSPDDFHLTRNSAAIDPAATPYDIGFDEYNPNTTLKLVEPGDGDGSLKIKWRIAHICSFNSGD